MRLATLRVGAIALVALVALVAFVAPAAAQVDAAAELSFNEGKQILFPKGKPAKDLSAEALAEACAALEKSVELEAALGSLNLLGYCREQQGAYASALAAYLRAAKFTVVATGDKKKDAAHRAKVKKAEDESARLQGIVSTFRITVPESARVDELVIEVGGESYGTLKWDVPIPIDGGTYAVRASAPGHVPWESSLTVAPRQAREEIVIPLLVEERPADPAPEPEPVREPTPDPVGELVPDLTPLEDRQDPDGGGMGGLRKASLGLGAVGVVALGAALVFELGARSAYDDYLASEPEDLSLLDAADGKRMTALGFGLGGGVAVGAAIVMWVLGGHGSVTPAVTQDSAMVSVLGGF
jgi:hypothetical protein